MKRAAGLQAIIAYKLFKAVAELGLSLVAISLFVRGAEAGAATLAEFILEHATRAWALKVATAIVLSTTTKNVEIAAFAAFVDAILSAVEGLALRAGSWWAPWLVVFATGSLLPWELLEILRRPTWVRALLLLINVAVVVYLVRSAKKHETQAAPVDGPPAGPQGPA